MLEWLNSIVGTLSGALNVSREMALIAIATIVGGVGGSAFPAAVKWVWSLINKAVTTATGAEKISEKFIRQSPIDEILHELVREREALTAAVAELQQQSRTAENSDQFKQALAELAKGRADAAEKLFRDILEKNRKSNRPEAARAASHIGAIAFYHDTEKALRAYEEVTKLAPEDADAWNMLGHLWHRVGNLENSESAFRKLLALGDKNGDDELHAMAFSGLGYVLLTRRDLAGAEKMFRKSLALNEKLNSKEEIANNYRRLGSIFSQQKNLFEAEKMLHKSLALNEELGRKEGMAKDYGSLGIVFSQRGNLPEAKKMLRKSLTLHKKLGREEGMANDYGNLGIVCIQRGNLPEAEKKFRKSLELNEELGRKEGMANDYGNLGLVFEKQGDLTKARESWRSARELFVEIGTRPILKEVEEAMEKAGYGL